MGRAEKEARRKRAAEAAAKARPALWEECGKKFNLDSEDIRMAKAVGIVPEKLLSLPAVPAESWKKPVRGWIREEYRKREKKERQRARRRAEESYEESLHYIQRFSELSSAGVRNRTGKIAARSSQEGGSAEASGPAAR